jgi:hypothetical protein
VQAVTANWPLQSVGMNDRPSRTGPISGFTQFAQMLLPGDAPV